MNIQRAKEILHGNDMIQVQCNGETVWIDEVHEETNTVKIHNKHNPETIRTVAVAELQEG